MLSNKSLLELCIIKPLSSNPLPVLEWSILHFPYSPLSALNILSVGWPVLVLLDKCKVSILPKADTLLACCGWLDICLGDTAENGRHATLWLISLSVLETVCTSESDDCDTNDNIGWLCKLIGDPWSDVAAAVFSEWLKNDSFSQVTISVLMTKLMPVVFSFVSRLSSSNLSKKSLALVYDGILFMRVGEYSKTIASFIIDSSKWPPFCLDNVSSISASLSVSIVVGSAMFGFTLSSMFVVFDEWQLLTFLLQNDVSLNVTCFWLIFLAFSLLPTVAPLYERTCSRQGLPRWQGTW